MRRIPGRPSKGERDAILAKPPLAFGKMLKEQADELGYTYGDYLVVLAAKALDMPQFTLKPSRPHATALAFPQEVSQ